MKNSLKLLYSLKTGQVDEFKKIIKHDRKIDVNHFYGEPDYGTLLDIACRFKGKSEFVRILLKHEADVNRRNYVTQTFPIHEAVENEDKETLIHLVQHKNHEAINLQNIQGNRPIDIVIYKNNIEFLAILLLSRTPPIYINKKNFQGLTPLHLALSLNNLEAASLLLEFPDIDLDLQKNPQGDTCSQIIQRNHPNLLDQFPNKISCNPKSILWTRLYRNETEKFITMVQSYDGAYLDDYFNGQTYLQFACSCGLLDVVDTLLKKRVNPNKINEHNRQDLSPLNIAAYKGDQKIFERLLEESDVCRHNNAGTVLYWVIQRMIFEEKIGNPFSYNFFEFMVNEIIPLRKMNFRGGKILNPFYAASYLNDDQVTKALIYVAVNFCKESDFVIPWKTINATVLEDYLDDCISSLEHDTIHNYISSSEDYVQKKKGAIKFNYKLFVNPTLHYSKNKNEMAVISAIEKEPCLRQLLKHPVSKSFLHMKWCLIKKYYYINLIIYFLFYISLNFYIILNRYHHPPSPNVPNNPSICYDMSSTPIACGSKIMLLCFYWIVILRELCQFSFSPMFYIKEKENWLEIIMIIMTGVFILLKPHTDLTYSFAAYAIITASLELVFILGKHPSCATYIEMFKTVAFNFFKFFILYSTLIISFGISFFILFKGKITPKNETSSNDTNENSLNFWQNPEISILKTITMLTGELGSDSLPFGLMLNNRHFIYTLFVFLIIIVLYNLLNGLAVSDTQAITENAEFVALVSRVKSVSQWERLSFSNPFNYCCCINDYLWRVFSRVYGKKTKLFSDNNLYTTEIEVFNKEIHLLKRISPEEDANIAKELFPWKMPSSIIRQAIRKLEHRKSFHRIIGAENSLKVDNMNEHQRKFPTIDNLGQTIVAQLRELGKHNENMIKYVKELLEQGLAGIQKQNE